MIIIRGDVDMASRMDRYRNQEVEPTGMRTKRNEHLYARVEAPLEYSSVEGVARIDNTSSVDINKIKELLMREEEPKKRVHPIIEEQDNLDETGEIATFQDLDEKNYDIRDILNKAKGEREEDDDDRYRSLQDTGYDILKNIKIQNQEPEINEKELKQVGDTTLSLSMLDSLREDGEDEESKTIQDLLTSEKESLNQEDDDDFEEERTLDNSFFTSSLNFSDEDFNELSDELDEPKKKGNLFVKAILFLVMVALTTAAIFFLANYLK